MAGSYPGTRHGHTTFHPSCRAPTRSEFRVSVEPSGGISAERRPRRPRTPTGMSGGRGRGGGGRREGSVGVSVIRGPSEDSRTPGGTERGNRSETKWLPTEPRNGAGRSNGTEPRDGAERSNGSRADALGRTRSSGRRAVGGGRRAADSGRWRRGRRRLVPMASEKKAVRWERESRHRHRHRRRPFQAVISRRRRHPLTGGVESETPPLHHYDHQHQHHTHQHHNHQHPGNRGAWGAKVQFPI